MIKLAPPIGDTQKLESPLARKTSAIRSVFSFILADRDHVYSSDAIHLALLSCGVQGFYQNATVQNFAVISKISNILIMGGWVKDRTVGWTDAIEIHTPFTEYPSSLAVWIIIVD